MNRILKRPMFKMGGSSGTGITSGLDRQNYQFGGGADARRFGLTPMPRVGGGADARRFMGNRMMQMAQPMNTNQSIAAATPTLSTRERLTQALGAGSNRNLGQFLTQFGLNLLSQSPTGNIFQTAATAAQEPTQGLFDQLNREQDLKRQIALEAERLDIGQEQAVELQLLKNLDEDDRIQIQKEAEILSKNPESEFFGKYNEAEAMLANKKIYGVQFMPGEQRRKAIEETSARIQDQERLSKPAADKRASYEVDFSKIQKDNENYDFDIMDPFWTPERKNYNEDTVYIDYVTGKAFKRDSSAEATPGVPAGFVEVQLK